MDAGAASEHNQWRVNQKNIHDLYQEIKTLLNEVFEEPKEMPNY